MTIQPPPPRRDEPTTPRALTVLLVDAHDHARAALAAVLTRLGHRALAASTCAAARDLAATHAQPSSGHGPRLIDLVIGHARLPDGDGAALVEELGPTLGCEAAIVTAATARTGTSPNVRHLPGPVALDDLLALLDDVGR
jgi:DNA-binding response OmpR family regulator